MKNRWMSISCTFLFTLLAILLAPARADMTYGFTRLTGDDTAGPLTLTVSPAGDNAVRFKFENFGEGVITDIYFADGTLKEMAAPVDNDGVDGVDFDISSVTLPPGELPWTPTQQFSASAVPSPMKTGVELNEYVEILFDLLGDYGYDDVIAAIEAGLPYNWGGERPDLSLIIGVHVQGTSGPWGSEKLVLTPLPGAVLLGMLGLGYAGMKLRRHA